MFFLESQLLSGLTRVLPGERVSGAACMAERWRKYYLEIIFKEKKRERERRRAR